MYKSTGKQTFKTHGWEAVGFLFGGYFYPPCETRFFNKPLRNYGILSICFIFMMHSKGLFFIHAKNLRLSNNI